MDDEDLWKKPITRAICGRCRGQCCYVSTVILDKEKADRTLHQYRYELKHVYFSFEKSPVLKKRKDGTCVYFDREKRTCSIYDRRPLACQVFFCGRGTKKDSTWKSIRQMEDRNKGIEREDPEDNVLEEITYSIE